MKISISNIAWDKSLDSEVLKILKDKDIQAIEVAPTKIWQTPEKTSKEEVKEYRKFWNNNGIEIVAIQSILFGHQELKLFEDENTREETFKYICKIIELSSYLGARVMVFGSPKNRNATEIKMTDAVEIGADFFYRLGKFSQKFGIIFCIEPNPKEYETNFINNTKEALNLVKKVNNPNFRVHLDLGAFTLNKEECRQSIFKTSPLFSHFHISEPYLSPIKDDNKHVIASEALKAINYEDYVSIEMLSKEIEDIKNSLDIAIKYYG